MNELSRSDESKQLSADVLPATQGWFAKVCAWIWVTDDPSSQALLLAWLALAR